MQFYLIERRTDIKIVTGGSDISIIGNTLEEDADFTKETENAGKIYFAAAKT